MQIQIKISSKVIITVEGDKATELFEQIARAQEVFGVEKCGKCGCNDVRFVTRVDKDDNHYYEMRCKSRECGAALAFGCNKKPVGGLFPKMSETLPNGERNWLPNSGWTIYNKVQQK